MEINIKKKKKPVWPWILAILVILAIIFVLYTQFGDEVEQQLDINNDNETLYIKPKDDVHTDAITLQNDIEYYDEVRFKTLKK